MRLKVRTLLIYLVSKHQNHEEDFFQIMCASQKVRTLMEFFTKAAGFAYNVSQPCLHVFFFLFCAILLFVPYFNSSQSL